MGTPVVRPPLGPPANPGMAAPRRGAASSDSSRSVAVTPFSCARYARICARTSSLTLLGAVGGMLMAKYAGFVLDTIGTYTPIFVVAASAYLIALLVIHLLSPNLEPVEV